MQIDKLQIELRPRSHAQALDLGFALLRSSPYAAYMSYAMLMLPFVLLAAVLIAVFPDQVQYWMLIPWWFKPVIERAPLYVLSRQVFGTSVSWQEAVRAWPRQLGGGVISLLTWYRLFSARRSFAQPVWQLEDARGAVARERRRTLGANGTARSAFWFGAVCASLELILNLGVVYFVVSLFDIGSPFSGFWMTISNAPTLVSNLVALLIFSSAMTVLGPIYTACGFTLYLNRRAALEAWDIEIQLRQITPPLARRPAAPAMLLAALVCCFTLAAAPDAMARDSGYNTREACLQAQLEQRLPTSDPEQQRIRRQIDQVMAHESLSNTRCVQQWVRKQTKDEGGKAMRPDPAPPKLDWLASLLQAVAIALLIGTAAWLLYRYRDHFPAFKRGAAHAVATEVGGLDIRAESLPPDVGAEVLALWTRGQRRAALGLLYRATLSRMVTDDKILLLQGDTEGDCLRAATRARAEGRMSQARLDVLGSTTTLWLDAAYGNRWPADVQVRACCAAWQDAFSGGSHP